MRPRPNDGAMTHGRLGRMLRDGSIYDAMTWQQRLSARLHEQWDVNEVEVYIGGTGVPHVVVKLRRREDARLRGSSQIRL